jgi:hypothetical protein
MFKSRKISKNAEFHADFEFVEKVVKMHQKNVISKTSFRNMSNSEKRGDISVTFLLITFCVHFSKLFQRIRNQREILRFLIPILNFLINFFFAFISTFCKLALAQETVQKRKIFFYECVLEFY